jgi:hypothetical protein
VFEALRVNQPWFYTPTERQAFKESLQMPSRTSVWAAKCVENHGAICMATNLSGIAIEPMAQATGYVTTMGFGTLVLQVLSVRLSESVPPSAKIFLNPKPGPWEEVTLRLWPAQQISADWPRSIGLSGEAGIQAFNDRW